MAKPSVEFVGGILGTWFSGGVAVPLALGYISRSWALTCDEWFGSPWIYSLLFSCIFECLWKDPVNVSTFSHIVVEIHEWPCNNRSDKSLFCEVTNTAKYSALELHAWIPQFCHRIQICICKGFGHLSDNLMPSRFFLCIFCINV